MDSQRVIGQTSGKPGDEWEEISWDIPLTPHLSEPGSEEQSNSKLRLRAGSPVQVSCITDSKETQVLQTLKWKGRNIFPRESRA